MQLVCHLEARGARRSDREPGWALPTHACGIDPRGIGVGSKSWVTRSPRFPFDHTVRLATHILLEETRSSGVFGLIKPDSGSYPWVSLSE